MTTEQRNSVGPPFDVARIVSNNFRNVVTRPRGPDLTTLWTRGITGGNNFCYRNAVLTAFLSQVTAVPYLISWFRDASRFEGGTAASLLGRLAELSGRLVRADQASVDKQAQDIWSHDCYPSTHSASQTAVQPVESWQASQKDTAKLQETRQQDALEFLSWLLGAMSSIFPAWSGGLDRFNWFFSSRIVTRTICERCEHPVGRRRANVESDQYLMLSIPRTSQHSAPGAATPKLLLSDLLNEHMHVEVSGLRCSRCKEDSDCVQKRKFQHAPALLTLAIMRAEYDDNGDARKNPAAVIIPAQLDISQHLNVHDFGEGSSVTYSLSSVISHQGGSVESGHYKSYVRCGSFRTRWVELDDQAVNEKMLSDFDDSTAKKSNKTDFDSRCTPYILMYERNFTTDKILPGRAANNVDEGENEDVKPSYWTGEKVAWVKGVEGEEEFPPAVVQVEVEIDGDKIEFPRHVISHLRWNKPRTVKIDARLRIPRGQRKRVLDRPDDKDYLEASISDMCYFQRREGEKSGNRVQKKPKNWNGYWRKATRSSVDLRKQDIQDIAQIVQGNVS